MSSRTVPLLIAAALLTGAAVLLFALGLGYDHWLAVANAASAKGSAANYLTPESWASIRLKGALAAAMLAALAALTLWQSLTLGRFFAAAWQDARAFTDDLADWLSRCRTQDGGLLWGVAALLTLGGIWLRWRDLDQPLRHDEALVFLTFVRKPLYLLVAMYNDVANHVLETVLKHFSWMLFGDAEWAIRLPVFVAGCLLPPLLFLVVRAMYGILPALFAAALAAGSSALLEYSVNARGYEFLAFWTVLLLGLRHLLSARDNRFLWLVWALVSALDFWTNPSAILSYGVVASWLLLGVLCRPAGQRLPGLAWLTAMSLLGALTTLLLYSPILVSSGIGHMNHMLARADSDLVLGSPLSRLNEMGHLYSRNLPGWLGLPLAAVCLLGLLADPWLNRRRGSLLLAAALWLGLFLTVFPAFGFERLWLPFACLTYMMAAVGLGLLLKPLGRAGAMVGAALALGLGLAGIQGEITTDFVRNNPDGAFLEAKAVAAALAQTLQPDDVVLAPCPGTMPLIYALERLGVATRIQTAGGPGIEAAGISPQVFTRSGAGDQTRPVGHPTGDFYLILIDSVAPDQAERMKAPPEPLLPADAQPSLTGFRHTMIFRLPMPAGLILQ